MRRACLEGNSSQATNSIFHRNRTTNFTICMETQKTPNSQSNFKKEEWNWRNQSAWLQTMLQSYSHQDSMVLAQRQKYRSLEQNRQSRDKSMHLWTPYLRQWREDKGLYSQSYGFSSSHAWIWELKHKESWASKNWCFWTVVLDKTLESPLGARRSSQSILKEINPDYSLEGLMLKLKLQSFGHLMWRANSLEKTLMLGETEGRRRWGRQRTRWLGGITD